MSVKKPEVTKLGAFDTIHDFWGGDRGIVSDAVHLHTQKKIIEQLSTINKIKNTGCEKFKDEPLYKCIMNLNLSSMTNLSVSSASSNFEHAVTQYFENTSSLQSVIKTNVYSISYGQIIDAWKKKGKKTIPDEWESYIQNLGEDDGLVLEVGTHPVYHSFGMVQHHQMEPVIAQFIMFYMFPTLMKQNPNTPVYFTFDTASGIIGKIFFDITQSHNLITPANIADSASTSLQRLNGRSIYHFPSNNGNEFVFQSNVFSQNYDVKMSFSNNKYSDINPYGFIYNVVHPSKKIAIPFSSTTNSGATVGYISDFLHTPNPRIVKPPTANIMKLNDFANSPALLNSGVLFDIKRAGDFEQANSAKISQNNYPTTILCTLDILCCLYSRCVQQPVILRSGENLTLYRFSPSAVPSPYSKWFEYKHKMMKALQYLKLLHNIHSSSLLTQITDFKNDCIQYLQGGMFLDHTKHNFVNVNSGEIQSSQEKTVEIITKLRILDIIIQLDKLPLKKASVNTALEETIKQYMQQLQTILLYYENIEANITVLENEERNIVSILDHVFPKSQRGGDGSDTVKSQPPTERPTSTRRRTTTVLPATKKRLPPFPPDITELLQKIQVVFSLSLNKQKLLILGENPLEISSIFETSTFGILILKPVGEIASLFWANKQWTQLYSVFSRLEYFINSKSKRLRDKGLNGKLTMMEYPNIVEKLCNGFSNKKWAGEIKQALLPIHDDDTELTQWYLDLEQNVGRVCNNYIQSSKYVVSSRVIGGANHVFLGIPSLQLDDKRLCVLDLYNLFLQITSSASAFVESTLSQQSKIMGGMDESPQNPLKKRKTMSNRPMSPPPMSPASFNGTRRKKARVNYRNKLDEIIQLFSQPDMLDSVKVCVENIAFMWENGLHEIMLDLDNVYVYQPSNTEYILLKLLSYYSVFENGEFKHNTDEDGTMGNIIMNRNRDLFQDISERSDKRYQTQLNDIGMFYLAPNSETHKYVPAEAITLVLLCILDNVIQTEKNGWMKKILGFQSHAIHFSSMTEWERLTDLIYMIVSHIISIKQGDFPKQIVF